MTVLSVILGLLGHRFMQENKRAMGHVYDQLGFPDDRAWVLVLTFWLLLVRYLPLDVVLLSETGKMIYSKFMEIDARMMSIDESRAEIISCKVQSMQLPE